MFITQVAADIFSNKLNFELSFPSKPTVQEVIKATEAAFSTEINNTRPDNVPSHTFHVAKIKVYDEDKNKWVDLQSEAQLQDYCQIYAFQPENPWHKETQKAIPPAVRPPAPAAAATARSASAKSAGAAGSGALAPYTGGRSEPSTSRRYGSAAPASTSTALVPKAGNVDASPEEKVRVLFSEFDTKGARSLELADLEQGFRAMGLDFSSATVEDLFERADMNRDGRISYSEFERFARLYPIMTDCLYFRSKAFWEEEQLQKEIEAEKAAVARAEEDLDAAQRSLGNAEGDVEAAQQAVQAAEEDLRDRTDRMRDLAREVEDAKKDKDRIARDRRDREKDLNDVKEREKEARRALQDLAREGDKADRKAAQLAADADAADDKVRQLQKALDDAKRAADRAHEAADQAAQDADGAKEREKDAALEADAITREIPKAEDVLRSVDRAAAAADQALKELDNVGKELGREADDAARRRDAGQRAVQEAKEKATQKARELDNVRHQADDRDQAVRKKEADLAEHRRQRDLVAQHERTLIEQELRLREQRDSLEQRETRLMSEAGNFLSNMRSSLAGRSYSRDPY